jgi:hypothetical protein
VPNRIQRCGSGAALSAVIFASEYGICIQGEAEGLLCTTRGDGSPNLPAGACHVCLKLRGQTAIQETSSSQEKAAGCRIQKQQGRLAGSAAAASRRRGCRLVFVAWRPAAIASGKRRGSTCCSCGAKVSTGRERQAGAGWSCNQGGRRPGAARAFRSCAVPGPGCVSAVSCQLAGGPDRPGQARIFLRLNRWSGRTSD